MSTFICLALGLLMILVERLRPGRPLPRVDGWVLRCIALNAVQLLLALAPALLWNDWMERHRPFSGDRLGVVGGAVVGYVAITFVFYWWHRARHASPLLWRLLHQVHHTPQRLEVLASFYKHPLEIGTDAVLTSATVFLGCGLGAEAAAGAIVLAGLAEFFYHWNVVTPRWIGFLMQRPESHRVHHQEGLHAFNYGDLPIWDMLFGTFSNPERADAPCGFGPEKEAALSRMLRFEDVTS